MCVSLEQAQNCLLLFSAAHWRAWRSVQRAVRSPDPRRVLVFMNNNPLALRPGFKRPFDISITHIWDVVKSAEPVHARLAWILKLATALTCVLMQVLDLAKIAEMYVLARVEKPKWVFQQQLRLPTRPCSSSWYERWRMAKTHDSSASNTSCSILSMVH
jgi:hypothetical protein